MAGPGSYIIGEEEKKALLEVVEAGYLFRYGDRKDPQFLAKVWELEKKVAAYFKIPYAVACNSGTTRRSYFHGPFRCSPRSTRRSHWTRTMYAEK